MKLFEIVSIILFMCDSCSLSVRTGSEDERDAMYLIINTAMTKL